MSEISDQLDEMEWADPRDRFLCERDAVLYGNVFVKCDEAGLARRVDPAVIKPDSKEGGSDD